MLSCASNPGEFDYLKNKINIRSDYSIINGMRRFNKINKSEYEKKKGLCYYSIILN